VLNRCFLENAQEFCDLITLDAGGNIILVGDVFVNVAQSRVSGVDAEISYMTPIALLGGDEELSFRAFGSWLTERSETNSTGTKTDFAGQTGARQADGAYFPYPDFKATGSLNYRNGGVSTLLQARYIAPGIHDVGLIEGDTILDNSVDSALYIDFRLGYRFTVGSAEAEIFGNVTNLFDEDPPVTPSYSAFLGYGSQYNASVYDVLGRRYTVGVRLKL
jgi:hypothetical protein